MDAGNGIAVGDARTLVPFNTFVTKVVSRCNLNCSYCYMYNLQDGTWRGQPATMSVDVAKAMGQRIAKHMQSNGQRWAHVILHGGEPLLLPGQQFDRLIDIWREEVSPAGNVLFSIQSNGTLIDNEWIDRLLEKKVRIGISIDGPKDWHDIHRVDKFGNGSFDKVIQNINLIKSRENWSEIFSNVMSVADPSIPPAALFEFWKEIDIPGFDISLPHANHTFPPPRAANSMSYGEWMIELFDLWFDWNRPDRQIRYFDNIIKMIFGYPLSTDNIGGRPVGVVVVETDGGIEPTDAFKCCEDGITKIDLNVLTDDFDSLFGIDMVRTLQTGRTALCQTCQQCQARDICGGGYMPHRYLRGQGFDNPSVYCKDIFELVSHISKRVKQSLPWGIFNQIDQPVSETYETA